MLAWKAVETEFKIWQETGKTLEFWWRDDDAVEPTTQLHQLLHISEKFSIPLHLAVIPESCKQAFPISDLCYVLQHGITHQNLAPSGEKKCELHSSQINDALIARLKQNKKKLENFFGHKFVDCMVPPWNRISPDYIDCLLKAEFKFLSTFNERKFQDQILQINTHLDIIDWSSHPRKFLGEEILERFISLLRQIRLQNKNHPIGLLTHHLVHDNDCWDFIENLLGFIKDNPTIRLFNFKDQVSNATF